MVSCSPPEEDKLAPYMSGVFSALEQLMVTAHGIGQGHRVQCPSRIQPASGFQLGHWCPGGVVWLLTGYTTPLVYLVNSERP